MSSPTPLQIVSGATRTIPVDYAGQLPDGVSIASVAVSATNLLDGKDASAIFGDSVPTIDGTTVTFVVEGVGLGERYELTITLTLDDATPSVFPDRSFLLIGVARLS